MKARYKVREDLVIEVDADTQRELFKELAGAAEVFGEATCGLCNSPRVVPACRVVQAFEFAEWHCLACGARLSLGTMKEGGRLFPSRKLDQHGKPDREHGQLGKHRGWSQYRGEGQLETPAAALPATNAKTPRGHPAQVHGEATISADQWSQLHAALKKQRIGDRAFLQRYGFRGPRVFSAARFQELLLAAQSPDAKLRAVPS